MRPGFAILTAVVVSASSVSGRASPLPSYDYAAQCRLGAEAGLPSSAEAEAAACMKREAGDRAKAARLVAHASRETVRRCNDIADTGDGGSYSVLAHCLVLEGVANGAAKPPADRSTEPPNK